MYSCAFVKSASGVGLPVHRGGVYDPIECIRNNFDDCVELDPNPEPFHNRFSKLYLPKRGLHDDSPPLPPQPTSAIAGVSPRSPITNLPYDPDHSADKEERNYNLTVEINPKNMEMNS